MHLSGERTRTQRLNDTYCEAKRLALTTPEKEIVHSTSVGLTEALRSVQDFVNLLLVTTTYFFPEIPTKKPIRATGSIPTRRLIKFSFPFILFRNRNYPEWSLGSQ
jgi:hypothetical protein